MKTELGRALNQDAFERGQREFWTSTREPERSVPIRQWSKISIVLR
jgi:hypothetical protein